MLRITGMALFAICFNFLPSFARGAELRTTDHDKYARNLWKRVASSSPWNNWTPAAVGFKPAYGPLLTPNSRAYVNTQGWPNPNTYGALIIARHYDGRGPKAKPVSATIWHRVSRGYNPELNDWYWAHYLADGTLVATSADKNPHARRGYVAIPREEKVWVFAADSTELVRFVTKGELTQTIAHPNAGIDGKTLVAPDKKTIDGYLAKKPAQKAIQRSARQRETTPKG